MNTVIRRMTEADIPAGMELKALAHWNQTPSDWQVFLQSEPAGCFAAVHNGRVVGTTTAIHYGSSMAWIGMVLVHPEHRRRGIATRLLETVLDYLADCPAVKLDATATGKQVYEKLGFVEESVAGRLTIECLPAMSAADDTVEPIADDEFDEIATLDSRFFGADRKFLLASLHDGTPASALRLDRKGHTSAYCFGRDGANFFQVGPVVAENELAAWQLCAAAMAGLVGKAVVIDVPLSHTRLIGRLNDLGFDLEREFVRMVRGTSDGGTSMKHQFAICGPEFG